MNCFYFLLFFICFQLQARFPGFSPNSTPIRVQLKEQKYSSTSNEFCCDSGFTLYPGKKKYGFKTGRSITVQTDRFGTLLVKEGHRVHKIQEDSFFLVPRASRDFLYVNGNPYHGTICCTVDRKKFLFHIINFVEIDDYLYGVLLGELYQSWPLEVHKVQAIVSRTYVLDRVCRARKRPQSLYDIKNNVFHQKYSGTHEFHHLKKAVCETKDLVLTHKGKLITAMFDSCCGGVVPALVSSFNFHEAPYLARTAACTHCKGTKRFTWKHETDIFHLQKKLLESSRLKKHVVSLGSLRKIEVGRRDKAGMVQTLLLKGKSGGEVVCLIEELKKCFPPMKIRSHNFVVHQEGNNVTFEGKGIGHGIGLCQFGAFIMVKQGRKYTSIIRFYYPQVDISRLSKMTFYKELASSS